jgi:hypothetical protein
MYKRLKIHPVASGIHASREITEGLIGCLGSSLAELINQDVGQRC